MKDPTIPSTSLGTVAKALKWTLVLGPRAWLEIGFSV